MKRKPITTILLLTVIIVLAVLPVSTFAEPGGVATGLALWLKADDAGTPATAWDDKSPNANPVETQGTMSLSAGDSNHNFNPYFTGFSTTNYFIDVDSSVATLYPPLDLDEVSMFAVVRANSLTADGRVFGIDNENDLIWNNHAADPGLSIYNGSPNFYRYSTSTENFTITDDVEVDTSAIFSARTSGTVLEVGLNHKFSTEPITAGGGMAGDILNVGYGKWNINGAFPGDIQEIIWYRQDVSNTERQQIESYLALKYGITLDQTTATDYLASDGTTKMWDANAGAGYNNDIAGIGRDDYSALGQVQSNQ